MPSLDQEMHSTIRAAVRDAGALLPDHLVRAIAHAVVQVALRKQADITGAIARLIPTTAADEDPDLPGLTRAHIAALQAAGLTDHPPMTGSPFATARDKGLWARHHIMEAQYDWLLARQSYRCALCPATQARKDRPWLAVDHDHDCCPSARSCGKCVRGLVCSRCNSRLATLWPTRSPFHRVKPGSLASLERSRTKFDRETPGWVTRAERYIRRGHVIWPAELIPASPTPISPPRKPQPLVRRGRNRLRVVK
ncbi:endonuclease domain-containing protein [Phytohabitans flavus]